jgi:hypothetical protein
MDYVFFSGIITWLWAVFLTYDIWCQYVINLFSRMRLLPECLQRDLDRGPMDGALNEWHSTGHLAVCQAQHAVQYQRGTGKTDGEGPERFWARTNNIAFATTEMGPGTRHDAIEDAIDYHNHMKNVKIGRYLFDL